MKTSKIRTSIPTKNKSQPDNFLHIIHLSNAIEWYHAAKTTANLFVAQTLQVH